jgi:AraC-like DNA-binding protein
MRPGVRTATLDGYVRLARSAGLDPAGILTYAGIAVADLAVPDKWVPAAAVSRVLERSAKESGIEDFGLRMAGLRRLATLGPLSIVLSQESDLRSALGLLCRYEHSYNEALRMRLDEDGDLATMRLWFEFGEPAPTRQATELATAALLGIIRELLGRQWEPLSICFTHRPPASLDAHVAAFGPRLQFSHEFSGLVFYATELRAANMASDPLLRPYAQQLLRALPAPPAATVTGQVTQLVEMLLPLGRCSTQQAARSLGVTQRTLHRQLATEGTSFSAIVHDIRENLAERYISADRYSLTEVSELLGFTAPSAFSRWFHQRFGVSPTQWRAAARQPAGG